MTDAPDLQGARMRSGRRRSSPGNPTLSSGGLCLRFGLVALPAQQLQVAHAVVVPGHDVIDGMPGVTAGLAVPIISAPDITFQARPIAREA